MCWHTLSMKRKKTVGYFSNVHLASRDEVADNSSGRLLEKGYKSNEAHGEGKGKEKHGMIC